MTRTPRTRTQQTAVRPNGHIDEYYVYHAVWPINASMYDRSVDSVCYDFSGRPYTDSNFTLERMEVSEQRFNSFAAGPYSSWLVNCPAPLPWLEPMKVTGLSPNWDVLAAAAMANANPNRPTVDVPLFIFELRDLPSLIKQSRHILRTVKDRDLSNLLPTLGGTNLAYNFGIAPMVDDLLSLFDFANAMQKQVDYLRRLEKGTKLHRTLGHDEGTGFLVNTSNPYARPNIAGRGLYMYTTDQVVYNWAFEDWYTLDVKLRNPLPSEYETHKLSQQIVLGLYANLDTAWNAIPWTWLIDWFTNFGDLASLTRGKVLYDWNNLNLMRELHSDSEVSYIYTTPTISGGPVSVSYVRKMREARIVPYATPAFEAPLLSKYQTGILASLALVRRRRGRKGYPSGTHRRYIPA